MLTNFDGSQNFLLITLDSCRWDTFALAHMPNLKSVCEFRKSYTQGTYTYPSHMSMFSGQFPNVNEAEPYYNRFVKYLFFIRGGHAQVDSYIEFPTGTRDIVRGFASLGYNTFGIGAVEWFKHPNLFSPFSTFYHTGIHFEEQIRVLISVTSNRRETPYFGFINVGETHDPYEYGGRIVPTERFASRMRMVANRGFAEREYLKQIKCCEYIDREIQKVLDHCSRFDGRTVFIVCGDHGECFGEDGVYGHGFFHPKVMEVPLGIFEL